LVKIQPGEKLAATLELNLASCLVTCCGEARGMGYWAATQVMGLSPGIFIVSVAVARYQMDIMGTREGQSVLLTGVCSIKPINGKIVQTTIWDCEAF
jgi:hypothetical protein